MKKVLLGVVLWAGLTFGSHVTTNPLNLIESTGITHPLPLYDFPFPSADQLKRLPPVTVADTNRSIDFNKWLVASLQLLEITLESGGITPKAGSAAQGFVIHGAASDDAMHYEKSSYTIAKASQYLMYTKCSIYGLPKDVCVGFISTLHLQENEFGEECAALERVTCRTNEKSKYRNFDGSCNNPVRASWGQSLTGYKRLIRPRYFDGIQESRRAIGFNQLPSARLVSTTLADNMDSPDHSKTIASAVWGQFIYHDLVHTPVRKTIHTHKAIRCCDNNGVTLAPRFIHDSCMPIYGPPPYPYGYMSCMEYTRSITTYRRDCTFGAAEQMNQATHFLDGSQIYGSSSRVAVALRERTGGLLKTSTFSDEEHLTLASNPKDKCLVGSDSSTCFNAGDVRANMHPWLTGLHLLWVKEHNRIARGLATLNPEWNSDRLFHEARRIVIAELQHITYSHWLTALTGKAFDELYETYDTSYNSDIDPTVTNSFATAAFHFINSLIDQDIELYDDNNNMTAHRLRDHYYKPEILTQKRGLEKLMRGMIKQKSQSMDLNYDDDLLHHWLGGLDVFAIDIQRGSDHGLPGYVHFRAMCGLPPASTFQHLADVIPQEVVEKLSKLYEQAEDIDLVVGLMAETPLSGSLVGPTATCLIKEQLWRTRSGDSYFYSHTNETGSFTKRQLAEIGSATLARVLCDNTLIARLSRDVFRPPSVSNPIVSCDAIKKVNLEAWQDAAQQPDILTHTNNKVS